MAKPDHPAENQRELALLAWVQTFAPFGVLTLDAGLKIQSWNQWLQTHSSLAAAQVVGRGLLEVFPDLETRELAAPFERALAGESSVLSPARHHHLLPIKSPLTGDANWMRQTARITPLLAEGAVCGVMVLIEDVTQRENQAETLLRQHRRDEALSWALVHLLKLVEPRKTVHPVFVKIAGQLDFDAFFLYLRDLESGAVRLYTSGGVADELERKFFEHALLADVADAPDVVIFDAVKERSEPAYAVLQEAKISSAVAIPLRVQGKSLGSLCFASWNRAHIAAEECEWLGAVAQCLATALDKENTQRELQRIEEVNRWMGAIVASSEDAIISKDLDGIIKSCNQGAARLFGYEVKELIGQPMRMLMPADHQEEESEILNRIREGRRIEHFETIRQRKDGSLVEISSMISPVLDAEGKIIGASNIARDITERRQGEQKLAESFRREKIAREKAESANRAKDDFLAALSHELRTPLNPILLLASDAAGRPDLTPGVRADFEIIRKNIELEARLIDDLLDITGISHGKLSLRREVVDVKVVLQDTLRNIRSELEQKHIELSFDFKASKRHVRGDDVRLQQVFWNILKNAVKFTPSRGKITVTAVAEEDRLSVVVTDTGIGMSPDEISQVFEAFSQGDHSRTDTHRFGGLGLGLAIARKLIEMHQGRIFAASEGPGWGSTFTVQLPTIEPGKTKVSSPPPLKVRGAQNGAETPVRILLVEDHEPTRAALTLLLRRRGYEIVVATNAGEARAAAAAGKFDLVISDIGLPDGSGNALMDYLRATFGLKGIALTGYGMEEDIEKGRAAGFVAHLIKPVNIHALEEALAVATEA